VDVRGEVARQVRKRKSPRRRARPSSPHSISCTHTPISHLRHLDRPEVVLVVDAPERRRREREERERERVRMMRLSEGPPPLLLPLSPSLSLT